jgi:PTS system nitrogen regulatory IIA component
MNLADILAPDGIIPSLQVDDKKQALRALADRAEQVTGANAQEIFTALLQRERLSSTSLGRGIAIPHIKLPGVKAITCLFARLDKPIPFDSHDGEPVDLLFFLLAPEDAGGDHLKALARISRLVRDPVKLEGLRAAKDIDGLKRIMTAPMASHAA